MLSSAPLSVRDYRRSAVYRSVISYLFFIRVFIWNSRLLTRQSTNVVVFVVSFIFYLLSSNSCRPNDNELSRGIAVGKRSYLLLKMCRFRTDLVTNPVFRSLVLYSPLKMWGFFRGNCYICVYCHTTAAEWAGGVSMRPTGKKRLLNRRMLLRFKAAYCDNMVTIAVGWCRGGI